MSSGIGFLSYRKRLGSLPEPPCTPTLPRSPKPVRPPKPECETGPDLKDLLKLLLRIKKKKK